jgi:dynein heavy chain
MLDEPPRSAPQVDQDQDPSQENMDQVDDIQSSSAALQESENSGQFQNDSNASLGPDGSKLKGFSPSTMLLNGEDMVDGGDTLQVENNLSSMNSEVDDAENPDNLDLQQQIDDFGQLQTHFLNLISLSGFNSSLFTPEHSLLLKQFCSDATQKVLFVYIVLSDKKNPEPHLVLATGVPKVRVNELMYFLKNTSPGEDGETNRKPNRHANKKWMAPDIDTRITSANLISRVQYGTIARSILDSLTVLMNGVYLPLFLNNRGWPDTVRKDFAGQLHKFMAVLTDTAYHSQGHTVLYVPKEKLPSSSEGISSNAILQ